MLEEPASVEATELASDGEAQDQPADAAEELVDDGADAGAQQAE